jgi:hypothetical protein
MAGRNKMRADFWNTRDDLNQSAVAFLLTDLTAAATLADIALHTTDHQRRERAGSKARNAYKTVLRLAGRYEFTSEQMRAFRQKVEALRSKLRRLGANFATDQPA